MRKLNYSLIFLLFSQLWCITSSAANGPTFGAIQDGNRLIEIEGKQGSGTTILTCKIYDGDLQTPTLKEVVVSGIQGKFVNGIGYHSMNDKTKLQYIEVSIREKMLSKSGTIVWLSPEMTIITQYAFNYAGNLNYGTPHDKSFLNATALPCFPTDHGMGITGSTSSFEGDSWLDAGKLVYLHYDFEVVQPSAAGERVLGTKKAATINSELFCFQGDKSGIKKKWVLNLEEERILFYHTDCSDGKIFLYTSYIKGEKGSGVEILESRIRMIDGESGDLIYNVLLDVKAGFELAVSSMYFDKLKSELFWAGNYISLTTKPWKKNEGETNSYFAIGKITADGKSTSNSLENRWTASEATAKNASTPLLFVSCMAMTESGTLVVAGMHAYWNGDCTASNYPNNSGGDGAMTFICQGSQVFYFTSSLEKVEMQQLVVPSPGLGDPIFKTTCSVQAATYSYDQYESGVCARGWWNAKTEVMSILEARVSIGLSKVSANYYAMAFKKGEKGAVYHLGELGEATSSMSPGYILDSHSCALRVGRFTTTVEAVKY